ncbi:MAG: MarR family transcriptional regulator [Acetobacteraceae bacterium]|nr:MarR family transcriptional regulator [Acetobacteraceae bacterium]
MASSHSRALFSQQFATAFRAWRRAADEALARYGLSQATAWPLVQAARHGEGIRQGALAALLGIEGPSLVRTLDHLCAAGLVLRQEDPADRRARTIHLTEAGHVQAARAETVLAGLRARLLRGVSPADLEAAFRVLETIQAATGNRETEMSA